MLYAQFPLGRPLGKPNDPDFQREVLEAAFALIPRSDVPVLVDFPLVIEDESDAPLACTIPLSDNAGLHPAIAEALGLRAAYERHRSSTGRTFVSRLGGPERVPELIDVFVRVAEGVSLDECGLPATQIGPAALDVRAYYEEAAMALVDHVPAARRAESWFYTATETGAVLRQARAAIRAADGPRHAWFPIVPTGQPT
jgi:hypothetical protein